MTDISPDEPTIPVMITVGVVRFHAGVKVSAVQGAIDRMVEHNWSLAVRIRELEAKLRAAGIDLEEKHG